MDAEEIFQVVKKYLVAKFEVPEEKVRLEADLFRSLGLDSIDALDMIGMLESEMDIEVNERELKKIRTVQNVVDYIIRKKSAG